MKELYIFNLKKEFARLYQDRPSELFYIFNRIYYMKEIDKNYGYNLFEQISNFYDKDLVNRFLSYRYKDKMMYSCIDNEHIINDLYLNEITILKVKPSNIRIKTNVEYPSFLKELKYFQGNLFVCNFKEQEYFFLKNIKNKVNN